MSDGGAGRQARARCRPYLGLRVAAQDLIVEGLLQPLGLLLLVHLAHQVGYKHGVVQEGLVARLFARSTNSISPGGGCVNGGCEGVRDRATHREGLANVVLEQALLLIV